uniref:tRNA pseudouridine synthase n=1 Tax=Rhabditophanes sp. KR3021 TaxID=114890 RepID=A0AC35U101_9BILA
MDKKKPRTFDSSVYPKRKVAFLFYYFGWKYDGLILQDCTDNTIEQYIRTALFKAKLIDDPLTCDLTRCGRTDKGVSAFQQVIALTIRSTDEDGKYVFWKDGIKPESSLKKSLKIELPFCKMVNVFLPPEIRIMAWSPVKPDFSARFNCKNRSYRYIFPDMNLNMEEMKRACKLLLGKHDYRNFCHIDRSKAERGLTHERTIYVAEIDDSEKCAVLIICASGFLWHQIRCVVALLVEIGKDRESADLMTELLDIEKHPSRPHYNMASEIPLCLYENTYSDEDVDWQWDEEPTTDLITNLQRELATYQTKSKIISDMLSGVQKMSGLNKESFTGGYTEFLLGKDCSREYKPILKRDVCKSISEVKQRMQSKRSKKE